MTRKILWGLVSGLMALSLLVAACGPAKGGEVAEKEVVGKGTPKYGGTITIAITSDPGNWDPAKAQAIRVSHMQWTSSELMQGDWTKGPQGTGESDWEYGFLGDVTLMSGELAESWSLPDDTTIIFNLRKGVKFHNKPPVNGREVTADDVVWNMEMQFNYPGLWQTMTYPPDKPEAVTGRMLPGDPRRPVSFKALDRYTVEVKVPAESQGIMLLEIGDNAYTNPPEIWVGTGPGEGQGMDKWDKIIGSGPFIITDFVPGSQLVYSKNPDYFETDPIFKGNKWPYVDAVKQLVIPDLSTRQAALRVGTIDMMGGYSYEDYQQMIQQKPQLLSKKRPSSPFVLSGRLDKPNLPFKDIRVRRALNLAVDQRAILRDYFNNDGDLLGFPYPNQRSWEKFYTPLEEMPKVQELYSYDPEKAKQLLTEAGYPNGFKAKVNVSSASARIDEMSILKDYLGKVGVDLTLVPMESGAYAQMDAANSHEEMWYGSARGVWAPFEQLTTKKGVYSNDAMLDDPYYVMVGEVIGKDMVKNPDNYVKVLKEAGQYELESAWAVWMPAPYTYSLWWPWIGNYYGIAWSGWANIWDWYKGIWIDTEMKKSMGY